MGKMISPRRRFCLQDKSGEINDYNHVSTFTAKYLQEYIFIIIMYRNTSINIEYAREASTRIETNRRTNR